MMNAAEIIGNNLKIIRKHLGYSQKYVADLLYISQQHYSRLETGKCQLNYEQVLAICKIYDITPDELFSVG